VLLHEHQGPCHPLQDDTFFCPLGNGDCMQYVNANNDVSNRILMADILKPIEQ